MAGFLFRNFRDQCFGGEQLRKHSLVEVLIEMSASSIDCDEVIGSSCKSAFQETIVWFVPDDPQLGDRMA